MLPYNEKLKEAARELRDNMTDAERLLWARLRLKHLGYMFCRQKPIGDYIVDFYCHKARLVVEVDGGQHFTEETASNDRVRDEYMRSLGLTVLRLSNWIIQICVPIGCGLAVLFCLYRIVCLVLEGNDDKLARTSQF